MSATDQDMSTPLDSGTPDGSISRASLTHGNVENPTTAIPSAASPSYDGSTTSTNSDSGGSEGTTTTPQTPGEGTSSDTTITSTTPHDTITSSTRTRTRTSTPLPQQTPPTTSARTPPAVNTWITVTRTTTSSPYPPSSTSQPRFDATSSPPDWAPVSGGADGENTWTNEDAAVESGNTMLHSEASEDTQLELSTDTPLSSFSRTSLVQQASLPPARTAASVDQEFQSPVNAETAKSEEGGMTGGAKAGLTLGLLAATVLLLLAFHFWRRHVRAAKRRRYLKEQSNAVFHRRNQSGRSSIATDPDWPPAAGEKHSNKGEDGSHVDSPPPSYLPDPSATSGRSANTWSMWVGRLAPGRPPSPSASTTTSSLAPNDPRISIIAPSPVSSRAALMANSSQHSRASSALSSNHLHPLYIHNRNHQRPLSTKSRESLATVKDTSGESSPVLSELTKRFPMPHLSESNAGKAQDHSGSTKTLASNNPYRTSSLTAGYTRDPVSANQRYSYNTIHSNEGERNPFEFETESGAFDVDFSQIGVTPAHSGHSTLNPTTPITPVARRKSASSLSLYSEEGHIRSLNPFLTDDKAPHKSVFQQAMPPTANNQIIETFGTAKIEHRPWSPLELSSTDISRKPSFVSSRSGQDFAAWEEEFGDHGTHTPKTFSKLVDMYAGRAM